MGTVPSRIPRPRGKSGTLYSRRGQQNKALIVIMKTIEAEIAERERWAKVAEEMQLVSYTELEV